MATCSICLDDILPNEDNITTLECNHPFHTNCISQLRSNKCPSCRTRFTNMSPEILSEIRQREIADNFGRNTENLNFASQKLKIRIPKIKIRIQKCKISFS